jgi:hypothetical protein
MVKLRVNDQGRGRQRVAAAASSPSAGCRSAISSLFQRSRAGLHVRRRRRVDAAALDARNINPPEHGLVSRLSAPL